MKVFLRSALVILLFLPEFVFGQTPVANFTATPLTGCAPLIVNFTSTSTGNPTSYQWNLGNNVNSIQQNPSTTYTAPGTYTVTLTVTNANGSDTKVVTNYITVIPNPVISFSANDTDDCPPFLVQFNNNTTPGVTGPVSYSWSFGDGNASNLQAPNNSYFTPGSYNVTLIATNSAGCTSTLQKLGYIKVFNPPVADFSASDTVNCGVPFTTVFTASATGNGPYQYLWDFGDGNTGTGNNTAHTYTVTGVYTVTLITVDVNGCSDTTVKNNYINTGAIQASFSTAAATGCAGTPLQFINNSSGATQYSWDFGDGNSSTGTNPAHAYATAGVYNVKLVVSTGACKDSITIPVTVNPSPTASFNFTPNQPCPAPVNIQFNNTSSGGATYAWAFGDGGTSTAMSPSHLYNANDTFTAKLITTNAFGCSNSFQDTFIIHFLGTYIYPEKPQGCAPLLVNFSDLTYGVEPGTGIWYNYPFGIASYSWSFGDGNTSTAPSPGNTYMTPSNIYNCTLTITTNNGCTASASRSVKVGAKPTASFTNYPDTVCVHTPVNLINTSIPASVNTSYIWNMGNTDNVGGKILNYSYKTSGIYDVTLVADDLGCTDTFKIDSAVVVLAPTALWSETYLCDSPLVVNFFDTLSIEPTAHTWFFGDGTEDTSTNPRHVYPALGTYTVSLVTVNTNHGCSDTLTKTIELVDPIISFTASDTAICKGDSIVFTPSYTATPGKFAWFIDGLTPLWPYNPAPDPNPSTSVWGHRFNQSGTFDISVVTSDIHNCADTATRSAYILVSKPVAGFTATPTLGCAPIQVLFTDTSHNVPGVFQTTRNWDFGNGNLTVNTDTVSRIYQAGTYPVRLIVTDNIGCSDTLTKPGYIEARHPTASFSVDDTVACIDQTLQFTNNSTGVTLNYFWDFGDGTTSTSTSPTKSYSQPGYYDIKLVVVDPTGCADSMIKLSYIKIVKPTASFVMSDTQAICPPLTVQFTNNSTGANNYNWAFGNNSGSALASPSVIYSASGIYQISLIVTDNEGCMDTATAQVNVLGYAGGLSYTPLNGCNPLEVQFQSNIYGVPSIIWDFNDGVIAPLNGVDTINHIYASPGAYVPKLILSDNSGCTNASNGLDTIKVDAVLAGFVISAPCVNTPVTFTDTSFTYFLPVTSWYWNINNGQEVSTSGSPSATFSTSGTYPVTLIATNAQGCVDTITRDITIYDLPVVHAEFDTTICKGDATQMSAIGASTYSWSPATGLSCTGCPDPSATPIVTTNYIVTGTDQRGCSNKDTVKITVKYVTESDVMPGGGICEDSTFQLLAYGADRYEWHPAGSLNNNKIPDPLASPTETTIYTVNAWEGSCLPDTHSVVVTIHPKPTVDAGPGVTILAGSSTVLIAQGENFQSLTWSPETDLSCITCTAPVASPNATTTYKVIATSEFGCSSWDTVTVHLFCDNSQVFIPNTFTPNNDGENDIFYPRGKGMKIITSMRVYNRWGEVVFERRNFQLNDITSGWDGSFKGSQVSSDIFIYSIDGICDEGSSLSWKGDITLIR